MNRFLLALVLIVSIGCVPTAIYYWWIWNNMAATKDMQALDYAMKDTTYHDLVFLGASKVEVNIDPRVIDSITGLNSYLLTIDGMGIVEGNMLLRTYLKRHRAPRYLFISTDDKVFNSQDHLFNSPDYFPYLRSDTSIYNLLAPYKSIYRSKLEQYRMQLKHLFATTDAQRMYALTPNIYKEFYSEKQWPYYKGFRAVQLQWDVNAEPGFHKKRIISDNTALDLLNGLVELCREKNIQPIFFYPPEHVSAHDMYVNSATMMKRVEEIAGNSDLEFLNYAEHPVVHEKRYYYNYAHLNYDGAKIFSRDLANDINIIIRNSKQKLNQ